LRRLSEIEREEEPWAGPARALVALGAVAALLQRGGVVPSPVAAPTSSPPPLLPVGVAEQVAPPPGAVFLGDACVSPRLPAPARLPALLGSHPGARVLDDGVRRIVVARGVGDGARTRLVIVGPVARAGSRGAGADDAIVAGVAWVTYHGDVAHLCGVGAAYVRDSVGVFGPGTQGLHLDMVVDGVTLLAQADIWTASAAYHVVGRLVAGPGPDAGVDLQERAHAE
jgi:hypothetical protein